MQCTLHTASTMKVMYGSSWSTQVCVLCRPQHGIEVPELAFSELA